MYCPECYDKDTELIDTDTDWGGSDIETWHCNSCDCEWDMETRLVVTTHGKVKNED